jgi:hypothetical protein
MSLPDLSSGQDDTELQKDESTRIQVESVDKYLLFTDDEGKEKYLAEVAKRIEERDPEVNMTEICE